jgi:hypothetical protein
VRRRPQLGVAVELADLLETAFPRAGRHRELEARRRRWPQVIPPPLLLHGGAKILDSSPGEIESSERDRRLCETETRVFISEHGVNQ